MLATASADGDDLVVATKVETGDFHRDAEHRGFKLSSKVVVSVEFGQRVLVVLDFGFVRLGVPERRLPLSIADRAIASKAFFEHPQQHRNVAVDVIEDADVTLAGVEAMQAPGVLDECPLP